MTKQRLATLLKQAYEEGWNDSRTVNAIKTYDEYWEVSATKAMADSLDKADWFLVADPDKMKEER